MVCVADSEVYEYEMSIDSQFEHLFRALMATGAIFPGTGGDPAVSDRWFSLRGLVITVQGSTPTGAATRYIVDFTAQGVAEVEKVPVMSMEAGLCAFNYQTLDSRNFQDYQRALGAVKNDFGGSAANWVAMVVAAEKIRELTGIQAAQAQATVIGAPLTKLKGGKAGVGSADPLVPAQNPPEPQPAPGNPEPNPAAGPPGPAPENI